MIINQGRVPPRGDGDATGQKGDAGERNDSFHEVSVLCGGQGIVEWVIHRISRVGPNKWLSRLQG